MHDFIDKIILIDTQIKEIVERTAKKIRKYYEKKEDIEVIVVLNGAKRFADDIFSCYILNNNKFNINYIKAKSYNDKNKFKKVKIEEINLSHIKNKEVLIIDDIYEKGETLYSIINFVKEYNPKDVKVCVLMERDRKHSRDIKIDFLGVLIRDPDFLAGYGLDYKGDESYRDMPLIATMKDE